MLLNRIFVGFRRLPESPNNSRRASRFVSKRPVLPSLHCLVGFASCSPTTFSEGYLMTRTTRHDPPKKQFWLDHLQRWRLSQLSARQYCIQQRFSLQSLYQWRKRLAQPQPQHTLTFIDITPTPHSPQPPHVELLLPNHRRILIPSGFDPYALKQLLSILEQQPCKRSHRHHATSSALSPSTSAKPIGTIEAWQAAQNVDLDRVMRSRPSGSFNGLLCRQFAE